MKNFVILLLAITILIACDPQGPPTEKTPIQAQVDAAKLIPGLSPFDVKIKASFIDVPGKGYLVFPPIKDSEREAFLNAVYLKYKADFDMVKQNNPTNAKVDYVQITCGEWAPINSSDSNSWVYRYCCNLSTGVCDRQTKECGYC